VTYITLPAQTQGKFLWKCQVSVRVGWEGSGGRGESGLNEFFRDHECRKNSLNLEGDNMW